MGKTIEWDQTHMGAVLQMAGWFKEEQKER